MSRNKDTRQQDFKQNYAEDRAFYREQVQKQEPTELQKRMEKDALRWYDFMEGENGPIDYSKAPGLIDSGLHEEAISNRLAERTPTGAAALAGPAANATALAAQKQKLASQMAETRGANVAQAVRQKDAMVRGQVSPMLIDVDENRKRSILSTSAGMASNSAGAYAALPVRKPWWQEVITSGIAAGGQIGAAGIMAGAL